MAGTWRAYEGKPADGTYSLELVEVLRGHLERALARATDDYTLGHSELLRMWGIRRIALCAKRFGLVQWSWSAFFGLPDNIRVRDKEALAGFSASARDRVRSVFGGRDLKAAHLAPERCPVNP